MAGLGSSLTSDFGGVVGYMQKRFKLGYIGVPRRCRGSCIGYGWLLPIFRFLTRDEKTVNGTPSSSLVNCGQAARPIFTYLDCTASSVPKAVDLIVIDGSNGLRPMTGKEMGYSEKLIRRLLGFPRQPAIIILHWMDWCACTVKSCRAGLRADRHKAGLCYKADGYNQSWIVGQQREDQGFWADLGRYYQLPTLSLRRAFHPMAIASTEGDDSIGQRLWEPAEELTWDGLHPRACYGTWQKCRYVGLIAAMFNTYLDDVRRGHYGIQKEPLPLNCTPMKARAREGPGTLVQRCFSWEGDRRLPPTIVSMTGWRVTDMDTAHSFDPPAHCRTQARASSRPLAVFDSPPVTLSSGEKCPKSKIGFTAFAPGSVAIFGLPVSSSLAADSGDQNATQREFRAILAISYLTSYEGMGVARVRCASACSCKEEIIDAQTDTLVSVWGQSKIETRVRTLDASAFCEVQMVLQNMSGRAGSKFKLGHMSLHWTELDNRQSNAREACTALPLVVNPA